MPDGFHMAVKGVHALDTAMLRIDRATDRATMWATREVGRVGRKAARQAAPILKDKTRSISRKDFKQGNPNNVPVRGLLRASITSSRRLRKPAPGTYAVRVAPRGLRVHLYSGKIEAQAGYMRKGYEAAASQGYEIARRAWARSSRGL